MKKIIIALMAIIVNTATFAQDRTEQASDIITVSAGYGVGTWSVSNKNFHYENKKSNDSYGFDLTYQHVWQKGWGFGANVASVGYDLNGNGKDKVNVIYAGPAAVYNYTTSKGWHWHAMLGLGYANQNDEALEKNGFGSSLNFGVDYKITSHFGIGLMMQNYATVFSIKELDGYAIFNNSHFGAALSYYF